MHPVSAYQGTKEMPNLDVSLQQIRVYQIHVVQTQFVNQMKENQFAYVLKV